MARQLSKRTAAIRRAIEAFPGESPKRIAEHISKMLKEKVTAQMVSNEKAKMKAKGKADEAPAATQPARRPAPTPEKRPAEDQDKESSLTLALAHLGMLVESLGKERVHKLIDKL